MKYRDFNIFIFCFLCAGCATQPSYTPVLSAADIEEMPNIKVINIVEQSEMLAQYVPVGTTGSVVALSVGGFLDVAAVAVVNNEINQTRAERAGRLIAPHRDALADYDATRKIQSLFGQYLKESDFTVSQYIVDKKLKDIDIMDLTEGLEEEKLLLIDTTYSFDTGANLIHVVSRANLYMSKKKESSNFKPMHEVRAWKVIYQTPRRVLTYAPTTLAEVDKSVEDIEAKYAGPIAKSSRSRASRLRRERDRKIEKVRLHYAEFDAPLKREPWNEDVLTQNLDAAFDSVAHAMVSALSRGLTEQEWNSRQVTIGYAGVRSADENAPTATMEVSIIEKDPATGYVTYLATDNTQYIVPANETVQLPAVLTKPE